MDFLNAWLREVIQNLILLLLQATVFIQQSVI